MEIWVKESKENGTNMLKIKKKHCVVSFLFEEHTVHPSIVNYFDSSRHIMTDIACLTFCA